MVYRRRFTGIQRVTLSLYFLLSLILSWPLPPHMATHLPGMAQWAFDESTFVWNIWYFKHAVVDQLSSPLHTELIYYPLGLDLLLYTYNFFHALLAQPLFLAVNLPFASNVALLLSTVLSGYGAFLLVRYLLARWDCISRSEHWEETPHSLFPPFIAGLLYAFASNRAIYAALGHYDMVTTQWIPFYALMLLRSLDLTLSPRQRRKAAALAGFFFALNGLAEMITALFLAIFTVIVLIVWWGREVRESRSTSASWNFLHTSFPSLVIIAGVALLVWGPVLIPILNQFLTDDFSLQDWGEAIPLSTDLWGWFTPTVLHPLFGGDLVTRLREVQLLKLIPQNEELPVGFRDINTVFLGWVSLTLALIGALAFGRRVRLWVWTAIIFGLFTLGPFLQINGQYIYNLDGVKTAFPLPYALLHYIPIVKANRAPNRNSVVLMLALAVLAAYGLQWGLRRLSRTKARRGGQWIVVPLCAGLILFEHLAIPAPLSDARVPAVYRQIATDPRPVSVLHLPLGWRDSFGTWGPERTQLQYFMTATGKPMLGGNISRAPDFKMEYFQRVPLFQALRNVQVGEPVTDDLRTAAHAQASELIYLYDVGYVLLMPPIPQRKPYDDTWQPSWALAKELLPLESEPFWADDDIEAYRTVQPAGSDTFTLDLGTPGTYPYRAEGWDVAEVDAPYNVGAIWATAGESKLLIPLRAVVPTATYQMRARIHPFIMPQSVALQVNDLLLPRQPLTDGWQEVTWDVPGSALMDGLNRLQLLWEQTAVPRTVIGGSRVIGATGVELPIDVDLTGQDGYIALFTEAGTQIDASAGRRGVNVTVLDPATGEVLAKEGFDTAANEFESQKLADFLHTVQPGQIVLAVSKEDATAFLTEAAVAELRNLGADLSLAGLSGQHLALVGVRGATPGSAAVEIQPERPFLRISLTRDRRTLAAAVDWVDVIR